MASPTPRPTAPPHRLIRPRGAAGCERAAARWSGRLRRGSSLPHSPRAAQSRRGRPERAPGREPRAFVCAPRWVAFRAYFAHKDWAPGGGGCPPERLCCCPVSRPPARGPPASPPRDGRPRGRAVGRGSSRAREGRRAGRWACGEPRSSRRARGGPRGAGPGRGGGRLGGPRPGGCCGGGGRREGGEPGGCSALLIVFLALKMERPCLERGCTAHRLRCARPDAEPSRPARPSLPGRHRGGPSETRGRPSLRLGRQRRGRGGVVPLVKR